MAKEVVRRAWRPHDDLVRPAADDDSGWEMQPESPELSDPVLEALQKQGYTWVTLQIAATRPRQRERSIKALLWGVA